MWVPCPLIDKRLLQLNFSTWQSVPYSHIRFFLLIDAEKKVVDEVFRNAIDGLSPEDRALPQVESVLPLLRRGVGIHHGGLLPLLKETVEILFGENLIKVSILFCDAFSFIFLLLSVNRRTELYAAGRVSWLWIGKIPFWWLAGNNLGSWSTNKRPPTVSDSFANIVGFHCWSVPSL